MKKIILSALVCTALVSCASDPKKTFDQNMVLAKLGNVQAQENVAEAYQKGKGVEKSYVQAIYWYKKAADNGCETCAEKAANAAELKAIDLIDAGTQRLRELMD